MGQFSCSPCSTTIQPPLYAALETQSLGGIMSVEHVKQVVGRALMDANFRANLFSNPSHALDGYSLSGEEFEALSHLTPDKLLQMQVSLGEGLAGEVQIKKLDQLHKLDNPNTMQVEGADDVLQK